MHTPPFNKYNDHGNLKKNKPQINTKIKTQNEYIPGHGTSSHGSDYRNGHQKTQSSMTFNPPQNPNIPKKYKNNAYRRLSSTSGSDMRLNEKY